MAATATDQLTEIMSNFKQAAEAAIGSESAQEFSEFEKYVSEVAGFVRETQQSMWADEAKAAIKTLERGGRPTPADNDVIRAFLISDAEGYLAHENNYGDWKRELQRLADDLVRRADMVDRSTIGDLRGVLQDAIRLVPDIRNYLEERQRVQKFESALNSLDDQSRKMLANLMREQLRSDKR